eukprot:756323-Hanusia_phi.AAC.2
MVTQDVVELHVHGGVAIVNSVLDALSKIEGLRLAQRGEYTRVSRREEEQGEREKRRRRRGSMKGRKGGRSEDMLTSESIVERSTRMGLRGFKSCRIGGRKTTEKKRPTAVQSRGGREGAEKEASSDGDFQRALLNGRMDLLEAEALSDLINAETKGERRRRCYDDVDADCDPGQQKQALEQVGQEDAFADCGEGWESGLGRGMRRWSEDKVETWQEEEEEEEEEVRTNDEGVSDVRRSQETLWRMADGSFEVEIVLSQVC